MSHVSTVVIISGDYSDDNINIAKINDYLKMQNKLGNPFKEIEDDGAGTKSPQRSLFWGGINYLDHDEFIKLFRSMIWANSLLIIGYEDNDSGYLVVPSNDGKYKCPVEVIDG